MGSPSKLDCSKFGIQILDLNYESSRYNLNSSFGEKKENVPAETKKEHLTCFDQSSWLV